jgi:uncharacterized membrane protein YphA (DoxX/SURF4 family)
MIPRIPQWLSRTIPHLLHWICRFILAGIFIISGNFKRQNYFDFALAIQGYKLFSPDQTKLVFLIARYFPWLEIALGISLLILVRRKIRYASGVAAALLLFFIVLLTVTYFRGIEANCGCFSFDEKISPKTIARDSLMLLPALYLLFVEPLLRKRLKTENPESGIQT